MSKLVFVLVAERSWKKVDMAYKLDKLVIIDVESTCWQDGYTPYDQSSEVIEIGICCLNMETFVVSDPVSIYIQPKHSTVSKFCTELTGITQELLDSKGIPFPKAVDILKTEYNLDKRTWGSWGDYDRKMMDIMFTTYSLKNFLDKTTHINLKNLFALLHGLKRELGTEEALNMIGLKFEGRKHSGREDARNIGRIARGIFGKQ
jgi:inhibitor of KinA sporulation pathway (predicted exonuclease)